MVYSHGFTFCIMRFGYNKEDDMAKTRATESEHKFIDKLGNWNPELPRNRLELLKKYLKAAKNRVDWHGIDKDDVIRRVESEVGG